MNGHGQEKCLFAKIPTLCEEHRQLGDRIRQAETRFLVHDEAFAEVLGEEAELYAVHEKDYAFAHEAGVYDKATKSVHFTANWQSSRNPLKVHAIHTETHELRECPVAQVINANGACQYEDGILFCAQGDLKNNGGLVWYKPESGEQRVILDHFHGKAFNSLNDVVIEHATGAIWFTDPDYGYAQGFRPRPELPNQVYRFEPSSGSCTVVEADLKKPNGLCFSPDHKHLYITDTAAIAAHDRIGDCYYDGRGPSTIYKYDVSEHGTLHNKRVFAHVTSGVPDGIKCDEAGNVYTGCGDGIHVFAPTDGRLLGKILVPGGVANFNFARGRIWIYNETKLWVAQIKARGCLEALECD